MRAAAKSSHFTAILMASSFPGLSRLSHGGAAATGVNGLQRANYGILFDLPFQDFLAGQACGRLCRQGQRQETFFYTLYSDDSNADKLILERHSRRNATFDVVLNATRD
ncbi:uncharacterized protein B0I36DRAFT_389968 [Microdochium trichocladiopsis]|uniref:Uncharacterized protein n=1 Tax=Microdochium trichocladiopsis TaxID=1682393 RepID=A0A9P8XPG1_9PEZI|nr:uncharacterized protein B0I36DRAFT_389968 [Microdochium trichocladiopsis]KAH7009241.1 hypothetical protein B0I36DRAFT_389968 [Microdochium trichocladiopsis]